MKRAYEARGATVQQDLCQSVGLAICTWKSTGRGLTSIPMDNPAKNRPASIISLLAAAVWRTPPRRKMRAPTKTERGRKVSVQADVSPSIAEKLEEAHTSHSPRKFVGDQRGGDTTAERPVVAIECQPYRAV
jgi:hypothetical protein